MTAKENSASKPGEVTSGNLKVPSIGTEEKSQILGKPATINIPFNKPCLFPECGDFIQMAFNNGKLSGDGLNSRMCTKWFAERFGYDCALLTPSCTAALEMAALLLDLGPGDEVIVPSFTFVSTANAFALRGVSLVFADSDVNHPNVCLDDILKKITNRTKAIVVVHYAGVPIDLKRLVETRIPIVEDCAHAIGTVDPLTSVPIGQAGCLSTFSFHETKNIGIGEGGMLVVNDESLWEKAQIIREKGTNRTAFRENRADFYTWYNLGSSYLLSDVDAGVLIGCLQHFDEIQHRRMSVWDQYHTLLSPSSLFDKPKAKDRFNAHMYFIRFNSSDTALRFTLYMKLKGILVATHYKPLDRSPFIAHSQSEQSRMQHCENSLKWSETLVRLPLFYGLSSMNVDKVVGAVNEFTFSENGLLLKHVESKYFDGIRTIRNEHGKSFMNSTEIDLKSHTDFMIKYSNTYRVAVDSNDSVVGFIGHVDGDLRLATRSGRLREGIAFFMWKNFILDYPSVSVRVKRDNVRSLGFFGRLGWKVESEDDGINPFVLLPPTTM